jgi:dienelactone hydrolase
MLRPALAVLFTAATLAAATPWDMKKLARPPHYEDAKGFHEDGVHAIFFDGPAWQGKPTRVFAWYAVPKSTDGKPVPAMVLVHGGGGTAFAEWVRIWNRRGYAAIAMDTGGCVPKPVGTRNPMALEREHHAQGGPEGWGGFNSVAAPLEDQWTYHAVSAVVLAHSLLRTLPGVDPKRVGLTGISWGGYLTNIAGSIDSRFRFAAPVYGCGFLGEDSAWLPTFAKMTDDVRRRWLTNWDPSVYLPAARIPFLWVTGTNDFAYPMPSLQKSYRLPKGPRTLAVRVAMKHNHVDGAKPEEIPAFADALFRHGQGLARITAQGFSDGAAWARYRAAVPQKAAELNYTVQTGKWMDRKWRSVSADLDAARGSVSGRVPECATVFYLNLVDVRGLVTSTEHVERKPPATCPASPAIARPN